MKLTSRFFKLILTSCAYGVVVGPSPDVEVNL